MFGEQHLTGFSYATTPDNWRRVAHQISDALEQLFGGVGFGQERARFRFFGLLRFKFETVDMLFFFLDTVHHLFFTFPFCFEGIALLCQLGDIFCEYGFLFFILFLFLFLKGKGTLSGFCG